MRKTFEATSQDEKGEGGHGAGVLEINPQIKLVNLIAFFLKLMRGMRAGSAHICTYSHRTGEIYPL